MFLKFRYVVAALAVLSLLMSGAVQARPLAAHPEAPSSFLQEVWQWAVSSLASIGVKAGGEMDPNGNKAQRTPLAHGAGASVDRTAGKAG
jgi:hypothetical protein